MDNPFEGLIKERVQDEHAPLADEREWVLTDEERRQKRDAIYQEYSPVVEEVLNQLIAAYRPGSWKIGSDFSHLYCCHINWFVGPAESHKASYDEHHVVRRRIEVTLIQDNTCVPIEFKIINHANGNKSAHVGLSKEELVAGIKAVLD